MLNQKEIEKLLNEGSRVEVNDYREQCRRNSIKTFYYFCKRLVHENQNTALSSPVLRDFILSEIQPGNNEDQNKFNPEGWFGYDWTVKKKGSSSGYCRDEYLEILVRKGNKPYYYQISPKYFDSVKDILQITETPLASDIFAPEEPASRVKVESYRILRDTKLARKVKILHDFTCQICGRTLHLKNGKRYAESHHIKPLGKPHNGPDVQENIICVCPNHHALLDYGAINLCKNQLIGLEIHDLCDEYINYHNNEIV